MTDSPTKISDSEIELEKSMIIQAEQLLKQSAEFDLKFRALLKKHWKDKKLVGELNDSITLNNRTIEDLKIEIKDRNSRIPKK